MKIQGNKIPISVINIILLVCSIFFALIISNFIGEGVPTNHYWLAAFIITIIIILLYYSILGILLLYESKGLEVDESFKDIQMCLYREWICCGSVNIDQVKKNFDFSPSQPLIKELEDKFSLVQQKNILEREISFFKDNGRAIWIVSSNLKSEIEGGAVNIVGNNLKKSIVYNEFYSEIDSDNRKNADAIRNVTILQTKYSNSSNINFIAYKKPYGGLDGFILDLFGIAIYEYKDNTITAYFSIRSSIMNKKPIYFKMPECMGARYFLMLLEIKNKYEYENKPDIEMAE